MTIFAMLAALASGLLLLVALIAASFKYSAKRKQHRTLRSVLGLAAFELPTWDARQALLDATGVPQNVERAANWAELLTPQLTEAFYMGYTDEGRRASMIPTIFQQPTSQRAFEEFFGVGVLGSDGWNFEASGRVQYDERKRGWIKRFTHVEFAKGFMVQRKLIDDNLTNIAFDDSHALGDSAFRKREKGGASVFNNAFTASGTGPDGQPIAGPDGVALCSASHPRSSEDTTTWSNAGSTALSATSLGTTRVLMQKFADDRGDIMDVMGDEILVPPELEDAAIVATRTPQAPGGNNNDLNPQTGRFTPHTWQYLTDSNNWFMFDSGRRRRALKWFDRIPLEFGQEGDFDTFQNKFRAYMRYSYGWVDPSWVYGHNV